MTSKLLFFCLICAILIHNLQSQSVVTRTKSKDREERLKLLKAYEKFEAQVSDTITSIFKNLHQDDGCEHGENEDGTCREKPETNLKIPADDGLIDDSLLGRIENMNEILLALIPLVSSSLEANASSANVPHRIVRSSLKDTATFSCDSEEIPLLSVAICFWERNSKGQRKVIHINDDVIEKEGKTGLDGILYKGDGFHRGDCGLEIQNFGLDDIGRWKCTLVRQGGETLTGIVTLVTSETRKQKAVASGQLAMGRVNGSTNLFCEAGIEPFTICWWERTVHGQQEIIILDQEAVQNGGQTSEEGISSIGDRFHTGECGLSIQNLNPNHFGVWTCTSVNRNGEIRSGKAVDLLDENEEGIYFGSLKDGLKFYSLASSNITTVPGTSYAGAVALDWKRNQIYWSKRYRIFRSNRNGTGMDTVLETAYDGYGFFRALAFDWLSGKIFVTSSRGFIVACDGSRNASLTCDTVITGQGSIQGLALDPAKGNLYWTSYSSSGNSSVMKGDMHGVNSVALVHGLKHPQGIAIDYTSQRLYWADGDTDQIQSSDLRGRDVQLVFQLQGGSRPWGIAVIGSTIYWSTWGSKKIQSKSKHGDEIATHYTGDSSLFHLAVRPSASDTTA